MGGCRLGHLSATPDDQVTSSNLSSPWKMKTALLRGGRPREAGPSAEGLARRLAPGWHPGNALSTHCDLGFHNAGRSPSGDFQNSQTTE